MVVDIVFSLIDNETLTSKSNVHLRFHIDQHLFEVRDRQHAALEQKTAHAAAKALGETSQSDSAIYQRDQRGEQIDAAGYYSQMRHGK